MLFRVNSWKYRADYLSLFGERLKYIVSVGLLTIKSKHALANLKANLQKVLAFFLFVFSVSHGQFPVEHYFDVFKTLIAIGVIHVEFHL